MTLATVTVHASVRDALQAQAAARGRTLDAHLAVLAAAEEKALRFERLTCDMVRRPADDAYRAELQDWTSGPWT